MYFQVRIRKLIYSTWENFTLKLLYFVVVLIMLQFQKPKVTVAQKSSLPLFFQFQCIYKIVSDLRTRDPRKAYKC
jgi:uncharacterized membrane protein YhdT